MRAVVLMTAAGVECFAASYRFFDKENAAKFGEWAANLQLIIYVDSIDEHQVSEKLLSKKLKRQERAAIAANLAKQQALKRSFITYRQQHIALSGLQNSSELDFWLAALDLNKVALEAVCSLGQSAAKLLKNEHFLLCYQQLGDISRHCYYRDGELKMARLTQGGEALASSLQASIAYIGEQHNQQVGDIIIVNNKQAVIENAALNYQFKNYHHPELANASAAMLLAVACANHKIDANHYANFAERASYLNQKWRGFLYAAAFGFVLLAWVVFNSLNAKLNLENHNLANQLKKVNSEYRQYTSAVFSDKNLQALLGTMNNADLVNLAQQISCMHHAQKPSPRQVLYQLSRLMLDFDEVQLHSLAWRNNQMPLAKCSGEQNVAATASLQIKASLKNTATYTLFLQRLKQDLNANIIQSSAQFLPQTQGEDGEIIIGPSDNHAREFEVLLELIDV